MTGDVIGQGGEFTAQVGDLEVELAPQHFGLGLEVAEERAPADAGLGGDLVDGGVVETVLGEQPQRDDLERARARPGRPAAPGFGQGLAFRHAMTLTYAVIRHTVTKSCGEGVDHDRRTHHAERRTRPRTTTAVVEDVLVEEVSIDGMCGVY